MFKELFQKTGPNFMSLALVVAPDKNIKFKWGVDVVYFL